MLKELKIKTVIILLFVILVYSLVFSFYYSYFVIAKPIEEFDLKFKNVQSQLRINLPEEEDTYFIKIWGLSYPLKAYFNSVEMPPFKTRERGVLKEIYLLADKKLVKVGPNTLDIIGTDSYSVKIKNFYGATASKDIFVLFKTSRFLKFKPENLILVSFLICIILVMLSIIFYFVMKLLFLNFKFKGVFLLFCICDFGLFLILLFFVILFSFTFYRVVFSQSKFIMSSIFWLISLNLVLVFFNIFRQSKRLILNPLFIRLVSQPIAWFSEPLPESPFYTKREGDLYLYPLIKKLVAHFKTITGQYLIFAFIFLLLMCMVLLVFKLYTFANWVSYIAYFCLVAGLVIEFKRQIKESKE